MIHISDVGILRAVLANLRAMNMTILVVMTTITLIINNIVKIESYIFLLILSYLIKCRSIKMASAESVNTGEDVKAENPTVPGFVLIENFITEEEEVELLEEINKGRWVSNRTKDRRVQVFGPYHDTLCTLLLQDYPR
jgi:hypothetical protein